MPMYTFESEDGQTIDLPFSMKEAPPIGELVEVNGKKFKRVFCGIVGTGTIEQRGKYPYLVNSMHHSQVKGAKKVKTRTGRKKALIESAAHEREVMARSDLTKESATHDSDLGW